MPALNNRLTESKHHNCNDILSFYRGRLTTNVHAYFTHLHIRRLMASVKLKQQTLASINSTERKVNGK